VAGDWTAITIDDITDGTTYQRVKSTAIDTNGMVILDQTIAGTYGLVLTTDISAGHIKLDSVADGTTYKLVLASQISAGKINLTSACVYGTGYDPSGKRRVFTATPTTPYDVGDLWFDASTVKRCTTARASGAYVAGDWTATTLDAIADGSSYARVLSTQISAGEIVLTSTGMTIDKNGVVTAASGTRVELKSTGLKGYNGATLEFEISATDGKAYFGAGSCSMDSGGLHINSPSKSIDFMSGASVIASFHSSGLITLYLTDCETFYLEDVTVLALASGAVIMPIVTNTGSIGRSDKIWGTVYATEIAASGYPASNVWSNLLCLKEGSTPGASSGWGKVYTKSDNKLYFQDGDGVEHTCAFV
jgi:hypothetical protein